MPEYLVKKASGDIQNYESDKLKKYLSRIELPPSEIDRVVSQVEQRFKQTVSTTEIRELVTGLICSMNRGPLYCARYSLKPALRKLGPAGHLFEEYIARLFQAEGYDTQVSTFVKGECVTHEVDVILSKDGQNEMIECKFHNREGTKSEVTEAMYTYARFLDIKDTNSLNNGFSQAWIATNTKLTTDAEDYAHCKGMKILSVELPYGESILDKVVQSDLFPITSLDIPKDYFPELFAAGMLMMHDIVDEAKIQSAHLSLPQDILAAAQEQARAILDYAEVQETRI